VLINMSSMDGVFPVPFATSYAAGKFGVAGFTDSLRAELAARTGIEVCGVYPGFVDTPWHAHAGNRTGRSLRRFRPTLDPEDVAERIVGLALRPRRALFIGGPPAPRLAAALTPDAAGRAIARRMERKLTREGPEAPPTGGAVAGTVPRGTGMRGDWQPAPSGSGRTAVVAIVTGMALVGALTLARHRA
jgi:short-subunit dehydrogenase